ncbi:kinetochore protein SPC25 homolog [Salvia miltiorrhiza]|uniref:kinetochore protein SPC25 homolog n=1 Tax=Salvia miltiorrhiza TaxID=226208 RepID=UPI0025AD5E89|nr:kinetochore protein SPC25 homolog [Salvia miltiorrhiza]
MQSSGGSNVLTQMAERRLVCEREIPIQQRRVEDALASYHKLFDSAKSGAQNTIQLQEKLGKLKGELREAEDALVKALAVKTRKEAKRMTIMESSSVTKARVEELKGLVKDQRQRKDEYAAIISQQSEALTACKEKSNQNRDYKEQIEEAVSWYNRVLGFRIECGHGVKFIFTNIRPKNPNEEYSFVIRHENETYNLLKCDPHLSGTKELVNELNKSNGLFKFVRTMRERFQQAAAQGHVSNKTYNDYQGISMHSLSLDQDSSIISLSGPVASFSTDHRHEPTLEKGLQSAESDTISRKVGKGNQVQSPRSASSVRRSSRLKVKN